MKRISLNGTWKLSGKPQESDEPPIVLQAEVPGCVQLDLSRQGFLPADLFYGENIRLAERYEDWEWWYEYTFVAPPERERVFLVFEGVDCLADYFLNGRKIGESRNMFIEHEFAVGEWLQDGDNTLTVHIASPTTAAHYHSFCAGDVLCSWGDFQTATAIRKAPHSYGWDIMPRAVTSGIWRGVELQVRDAVGFSQLYFQTNETGARLFYEIDCARRDFHGLEIEVTASCGADSHCAVRAAVGVDKTGVLALPVENPKKWFPYGYGEANVYDGEARLYRDGRLLHAEPIHFGLRTVVLDRTDETDGQSGRFRFLVNGVEILCKGSNWVPLDAFHCRDEQRYDRALALVKDIGCNILRCWGGNVYEQPRFFDFCDRHGIMVWQDFAMACRWYPQTDEFADTIRHEVRAVVRKLRNHPSIILWSGDNEVDLMAAGNGRNPDSNRLTREVIPALLAAEDPARPYLPSSPYMTAKNLNHNGWDRLSEDHLWGPRDYFKSDFYKNSKAHFVSETGYHGCPSWESIQKFITPENCWPYQHNPEWILHSSDQHGSDYRVMLMEKQVRQLFGEVPTDPETYIRASQISQAEAKKYFIERVRVGRPHKSGVIWWNLLDGWPQMSDAVVDYYFVPKTAYRYIKRSQAPFVIAADELSNWRVRLYACNDTLREKHGHLTVLNAEDDTVLLDCDFTAPANASTVIAAPDVAYSDKRMLIFRWEADGERGFNHYLCGYPPVSLEHYTALMEKYGL